MVNTNANLNEKQIQGRVIINADDYGCDEVHTIGIIKAFEAGLISNATIMVNMPFFDEACYLAEKYGFKERIGLHLNLVEGMPLTEGIRQCATFCNENGIFHGGWRTSTLKTSFLNKKEKKLLTQEILAQFMLFEERGFSLKHFDTHGHAHTYFSVWRLLKKILKANGYNYSVRLAKNLFEGKSNRLKVLYKRMLNKMIPKEMKCSDYFTDIRGYLKNISSLRNDSSTEIMCHPCWINGELFNPDDLQIADLHGCIPNKAISYF